MRSPVGPVPSGPCRLAFALKRDVDTRPKPCGVSPATRDHCLHGMTVTMGRYTAHLEQGGVDYWFCSPGCCTRHAEELGAA